MPSDPIAPPRPELLALLDAVKDHPDEDTPRLVLADWLQEHDDPRGELMRLQVRLAAMPAGDPEYDTLFDQHQKWWKQYGKMWEKEVGTLSWDAGPHDRGLPVVGYHGGEDDWLNANGLGDPEKDRLSAVIAAGWPGMTWVVVENPRSYDGVDDHILTTYPEQVARLIFEPFERAPWAGSPTPVRVGFPYGIVVTPAFIDRVAKIPNLRGFSVGDAQLAPDLLPRIAKIKSLEHLDLAEMRLTDDDVRTLAPLKHLRTLIANGATITNTGAKTLAKFTDLRELRLSARGLTAAGYQSLATLAKLEVLELRKADDATVRHLAPLQRLRRLDLSGTKVTSRGLEQFPLLTHLELDSTQLDDESFASIAALPRLRRLAVGCTRITGAAFEQLTGLRWLWCLYARRTDIRDKHLAHLEGLRNLELVALWDTKVTQKGAKQLQKKLKTQAVYR
jgi:uncharacterized protein (TIGR02996 family)